jgi:phosphohistidine phosphatase
MPTLYLVRHAIAADRGDAWPDDDRRPLTHDGITRMRAAVAGLRAMGVTFDAVLASPLVRARQTADLLVEGLKPKLPVIETSALAPGRACAEVGNALSDKGSHACVALVGHEPGLGDLAAWLIGAHTPLVFKKGGVCCIDCASPVRAGAGTLQWMALPRMLRALGA